MTSEQHLEKAAEHERWAALWSTYAEKFRVEGNDAAAEALKIAVARERAAEAEHRAAAPKGAA